MNRTPKFDPQTKEAVFHYVLQGYLNEAALLSRIATTDEKCFREIADHFRNYQEFLSIETPQFLKPGWHSSIEGSKTVLELSVKNLDKNFLLEHANLAAACSIFANWVLTTEDLKPARLQQLTKDAVLKFHQGDLSRAIQLSDKLNGADTIRVIQILKLLGLVQADTSRRHQLSFGAARGERDIRSMHLYPMIKWHKANSLTPSPTPERIEFGTRASAPQDAVLIDNNPMYESLYAEFSQKTNGSIKGIHQDSYEAMETLSSSIANNEIMPRDLIVAFRIDHIGLPNVPEFFHRLSPLLAEEADLVVTIGSGHTNADFEGRLEKMLEIRTYLTAAGLQPLHIKLHHGGKPNKQRKSPAFGTGNYASFEIIYCRLSRGKLIAA